jgi:hypothetical protein
LTDGDKTIFTGGGRIILDGTEGYVIDRDTIDFIFEAPHQRARRDKQLV